ncbi:IclR family transcriptional regulator [Sulfobacillus thermotolerans]|uniref:IclR family transcriptional regulator n=1 Tax=Sulfobacillus thermotolerans TaxID=338644 RepID=A0ABM6RRV1_9FIRM|nr:IclR family transcriptional regulator [Sulfobacillus thermotolerans]
MSNSTIHSLSRGLRLLDYIAQYPEGVTVKWLSAATGIPLGTCYHLIKTMVEEGYVEKDKITLLYKLSYKIAYLYNQMRPALTVPDAIRSLSHEIVADLQETTYVAKWEHEEVIIEHIAEGNQAVKVRALYVGYRDHAFVHALGKAILSALPPRVLARYRQTHFPVARTARSHATDEQIVRELQITAERGYSLDVGEWEDGVCCCIGAPIFQYDGTIWGAVAISMPESRYDPRSEDTVHYLKKYAQAMSKYLGQPQSSRSSVPFLSGP